MSAHSFPSFSSFPDLDALNNQQSSSLRSQNDSDRHHSRPTHDKDSSHKKERRKDSRERSEKRSKRDKKEKDRYHKSKKYRDTPEEEKYASTAINKVREEDALNRYFYSDRRGDFLNIQYGGLHVGDVPKYYLVDRGRHVLGLPHSFVVHRRSGKGIDIAPKNYRKLPTLTDTSVKSLLAATPTRQLFSLQDSGRKYEEIDGVIHLPSSSKRKEGDDSYRDVLTGQDANSSASETSESDQSSSEDEDGQHILTSHQMKIKELERKLKESPDSGDTWLSYLSQSLSVVPVHSKNSLRARSDISVSILGRSLKAHPSNSRNKVLRLAYLKAGEQIWSASKLEDEWKSALNVGGADIELEWLEWRIRQNRRGVDGIVADADRMMRRLPADEEGEISKLRIMWRVAVAVRNAGFTERATAMFQAQAELTFNRPSDFVKEPLNVQLDRLEEFWDSEYPRIGEKGAKGWSYWHTLRPSTPPTPSTNPHTLDIKDLDPYRQWARNELVSDRLSWLPSRADAESLDPYATVLFTDIRPMLFDIHSARAKQTFRLVWLSFLGLNIPGLSLGSTIDTDWDDRWKLNYLMSPPLLESVFSSMETQSKITTDAVAGALIGRERQYTSSFAPIRNWTTDVRPLFDLSSSEQDITHRRGVWTKKDIAEVDEVVAKELFSQLKFGKNDERWDTLAVAYEMASNPKSALKLSKSLLAVNSDSLVHWDNHAQLERFRGRLDEARKVYTAVLVQSNEKSMLPAAGRLWWNWAEMEWLAGGDQQAINIITKSAGIDPSPSPLTILRADRALQDLIRRLGNDWKTQEPWVNLRALLKLTTTSDPLAAVQIFDESSVESSSESQKENLMTSSLLMLYHHSVTLKNSMAPSILRDRAQIGIETYPENTVILGVFLEGEKGQGIWGKIRATLGDNEGKPKSVLRRVIEVWIAGWDKSRWMSEIERTRVGLSAAVDHERTRGSAIIWRFYIELEIRLKELQRAKGLLYRAISECPLVKELYLLAFGPLRSVFPAIELHRLADSMVERGLRLRQGLEEVVDGIPMEIQDKNDEDEVEDEIEEDAKEYRRLLPY